MYIYNSIYPSGNLIQLPLNFYQAKFFLLNQNAFKELQWPLKTTKLLHSTHSITRPLSEKDYFEGTNASAKRRIADTALVKPVRNIKFVVVTPSPHEKHQDTFYKSQNNWLPKSSHLFTLFMKSHVKHPELSCSHVALLVYVLWSADAVIPLKTMQRQAQNDAATSIFIRSQTFPLCY